MLTLMIFDIFILICFILKVALDLTEDEKVQLQNMVVDAAR